MQKIFRICIFLGLSLLIQPAHAGCFTSMNDGIGKGFNSYSFCKNTIDEPKYEISWFSSIDSRSDKFLMLFNFDSRGVSATCRDFSINGYDESECQAYAKDLRGNLKIPKKYQGRKFSVFMLNIDNKNDREDILNIIEKKDLEYKSSSNISQLKDSGCFSGVNFVDEEIYFGYSVNNFYKLAYCIQSMEEWISSDSKIMNKIIK